MSVMEKGAMVFDSRLTPLSSSLIMDMRGLQALWGPLAPFPAVFSGIDRWNRPSAETRVQLQSPPAHFLPPGVPFLDKGYISVLSHLSALCCPALNRLRTVSHPVIPPSPAVHTRMKPRDQLRSDIPQSRGHLMWKICSLTSGEFVSL